MARLGDLTPDTSNVGASPAPSGGEGGAVSAEYSALESAGGFAINGNWNTEFRRFIGKLGGLSTSWRRAEPQVQDQAADIIADLYRNFLREGVGPENTVLTQILGGVHPPMSGLADHVVVIHSGQGKRSTASTYPGRPKPALVTFEQGWGVIAFLHDRGYTFIVKPSQRDALFKAAKDIAGVNADGKPWFLSEGFSTGGIWTVPPRPHVWFLRSPLMDRMLELVAGALLAGKQFKIPNPTRPASTPWRPLLKRLDDVKNL